MPALESIIAIAGQCQLLVDSQEHAVVLHAETSMYIDCQMMRLRHHNVITTPGACACLPSLQPLTSERQSFWHAGATATMAKCQWMWQQQA